LSVLLNFPHSCLYALSLPSSHLAPPFLHCTIVLLIPSAFHQGTAHQ
jgi:hypothetical protein